MPQVYCGVERMNALFTFEEHSAVEGWPNVHANNDTLWI